MYFTGSESCLEVEAKRLRREDVLPLLAWSLNQHLGGIRSLLPQLLLGIMQLLAYPASHCQSKERKLRKGALEVPNLLGLPDKGEKHC